MKMIIVIPARYNSSRFPGKPLIKINGIPMIKRVYNQCLQGFDGEVIVATDDERIKDYCKRNNIDVKMTSANCITGTDRVYQAAINYDNDLVINIQGDEPIFNPKDIKKFISEVKKFSTQYEVFAGYTEIKDSKEYFSSQIPKMLIKKNNELLFTSRSPIPGNKNNEFKTSHKQVCIYAYTFNALKLFCSQRKTPIEETEDLELLRFLENDIKIKMVELSGDSISVDNPEDILKVEIILKTKK